MSSCTASLLSSAAGEYQAVLNCNGNSPTGISSPSPPPPAPIIRRRPRRIRGEAQRCSIPHPTASMSSPPLIIMKRKPDASPSAPLKRFRGNETAALFFREPYDAAIDRARAASVAAALDHAFWAPEMASAGGVELKIEDYLIAMTGAKLAKLPLF